MGVFRMLRQRFSCRFGAINWSDEKRILVNKINYKKTIFANSHINYKYAL